MMKLLASEFFKCEEQAIAVERRSPQYAFPLHEHEFNELFIVLSGNGWHILNGAPHFITCGELFYVRASDQHQFVDVDNLHLVNILYRLEMRSLKSESLDRLIEAAEIPGSGDCHWQITEDVTAKIRPLIDELEIETRKFDPFSQMIAESIFVRLCTMLYRHRFTADSANLPAASRFGHILRYIRHHCTDEVDFEDVSRRFGYSLRNFNRIFREATGTTPHNYLVKLRISEAMRSLRHSDENITNVAFQAGFSDSNYFSSTFNRLTGMSPSEYRRLSQVDWTSRAPEPPQPGRAPPIAVRGA